MHELSQNFILVDFPNKAKRHIQEAGEFLSYLEHIIISIIPIYNILLPF
jgi:hypothetical protein